MERWQNKVAVVTGASSGIGAATVKALVAKGMIVVGLARRFERMENELKAGLPAEQQTRFHPIRCDVCQEESILQAFAWIEQHLGGVDVLVNNAGITRQTQIVSDNNTAQLRAMIDTNLMSVALCTREAFRSMKSRGVDGHVININGFAGHYALHVPGLSLNLYSPTKFGITALTEVLRREFLLHQTKIKVTSVSPGAVYTEIVGNCSNVPIEYPLLQPDDVVDVIVYTLQTPPHVQIHEIMLRPIGEMF